MADEKVQKLILILRNLMKDFWNLTSDPHKLTYDPKTLLKTLETSCQMVPTTRMTLKTGLKTWNLTSDSHDLTCDLTAG